ncbi:MAG: TonB-dependent receptor, partial [Cyclobacteriaceae bacterium]
MIRKFTTISLAFFFILACFGQNEIKAETATPDDRDYIPNIKAVKISLEVDKQNLLKIFQLIEAKTIFSFSYNSKKIKNRRTVSLNFKDEPLAEILNTLAKEYHLDFRQVNRNIMVSPANKKNVDDEKPTIIRGTIIDEQTNEPLTGATIRVVGTTIGAVTDLQGEYVLRVTPGMVNGEELQLQISYIGYDNKNIPVQLAGENVKRMNLSLSSKQYELKAIEVIGQLQGQQKALNQQKTANNIKNIVAADQIGRFPDPNVAEALQRIPAVNIERDQGEGRYVFIRGLAPKFTNVSVNGEQIPSPEADVRYVALDAIPADQLASIEVNKALTPDMDGDAVGGSINLITRTAQGGAPQISATAVGGYNNLMQAPNTQFSLQYGQRFGKNEKFGVLLNGSHYLSDRGSDNWERAPEDNELELRDYELRRTRLGLSATLDYRFNDRSEIYFRSLYSRFDDHEFRRTFLFVPEDLEIEREVKDRYEIQSVQSYNFGGRHFLSGVTLDYEASYSYSFQDTPDDFQVVFIGEANRIDLDFSDTEFPGLEVEVDEEFSDFRDNNLYEFDEFEFGGTLTTDRNLTGKFNLEIPYSLNGNSATFKFGGKVRFKEKDLDINVNFVEWTGENDDLLISGLNGQGLSGDGTGGDFSGSTFDNNFLNGKYQLAVQPELDKVINFYNNNLDGFAHNVVDKLADENLEAFTANEDVYAGYAMTTINFDKLALLGGFRYEFTEVSYDSKNVIFNDDGDLESIEDQIGGTSYGYLLPQFHLKYKVDPNTNLRAAATFSYARPNFAEIVPAQEFNLEDDEITAGNPDLEPVRSFNLDLFGERYFGNVGILSGGLFYKKLNNFIYNDAYRTTTLNNRIFDDEVTVFQAVNGETADL